jgi:hypothetical protein
MGYLNDKCGMNLHKFYYVHGRCPTWEEVRAYCPRQVKKIWIVELKKRGVKVK